MPIYTLYLSTQISAVAGVYNNLVPIDKSNLANVTWFVNWNDLFKDVNQNGTYSHCRLRYNLISQTSANLTVTNATGYLTISGLSTNNQSSAVSSTILGMITPALSPLGGTNYYYNIGSLEQQGININTPQGNSQISVRFFNDDAMSLMTSANLAEYTLLLQFELYNE